MPPGPRPRPIPPLSGPRARLAAGFLAQALAMAGRHARGLPPALRDELASAAALGCVKAAARYDYRRHWPTWAAIVVRGEVLMAIRSELRHRDRVRGLLDAARAIA